MILMKRGSFCIYTENLVKTLIDNLQYCIHRHKYTCDRLKAADIYTRRILQHCIFEDIIYTENSVKFFIRVIN